MMRGKIVDGRFRDRAIPTARATRTNVPSSTAPRNTPTPHVCSPPRQFSSAHFGSISESDSVIPGGSIGQPSFQPIPVTAEFALKPHPPPPGFIPRGLDDLLATPLPLKTPSARGDGLE